MTNLADELERLAKRCAEIDAHYARYPDTLDRTAEQHAADIRSLVSALRREEALWCCHARGPDDLFASPDFETAVAWSDTLNAVGDLVRAVPARWPGSPEQHAADLPRSIAGFRPRRAPKGATHE